MSKSDIPVICNLTAGGGSAAGKWARFLTAIHGTGVNILPFITKYRGHATRLAADCIGRGHHRIAVFGGDGTLNEVLQAAVSEDGPVSENMTLIFLPAGSSCDLEKGFTGHQPLPQRLTSTHTHTIDICSVRCRGIHGNNITRFFLVNSSIGIISQAIHRFNQPEPFQNQLKRFNVDIAALYAGIKALFSSPVLDCEISIDGKGPERHLLSNSTVLKYPYFGGGMNYGVSTFHDDGKFHVMLIDYLHPMKLLLLIPRLYMGNILSSRHAHHHIASSVEISATGNIVETDGEIVGYPPARYSVLPRKLRIVL